MDSQASEVLEEAHDERARLASTHFERSTIPLLGAMEHLSTSVTSAHGFDWPKDTRVASLDFPKTIHRFQDFPDICEMQNRPSPTRMAYPIQVRLDRHHKDGIPSKP